MYLSINNSVYCERNIVFGLKQVFLYVQGDQEKVKWLCRF